MELTAEKIRQMQKNDEDLDLINDNTDKIAAVSYDINMIKSGRQTYNRERMGMITNRARKAIQELNSLCREAGLEPPFPDGHIDDEKLYEMSFYLRKEETNYYADWDRNRERDEYDEELDRMMEKAGFAEAMEEYDEANTERRKEIMRELCLKMYGEINEDDQRMIDSIDAEKTATEWTYDLMLKNATGRELGE